MKKSFFIFLLFICFLPSPLPCEGLKLGIMEYTVSSEFVPFSPLGGVSYMNISNVMFPVTIGNVKIKWWEVSVMFQPYLIKKVLSVYGNSSDDTPGILEYIMEKGVVLGSSYGLGTEFPLVFDAETEKPVLLGEAGLGLEMFVHAKPTSDLQLTDLLINVIDYASWYLLGTLPGEETGDWLYFNIGPFLQLKTTYVKSIFHLSAGTRFCYDLRSGRILFSISAGAGLRF